MTRLFQAASTLRIFSTSTKRHQSHLFDHHCYIHPIELNPLTDLPPTPTMSSTLDITPATLSPPSAQLSRHHSRYSSLASLRSTTSTTRSISIASIRSINDILIQRRQQQRRPSISSSTQSTTSEGFGEKVEDVTAVMEPRPDELVAWAGIEEILDGKL